MQGYKEKVSGIIYLLNGSLSPTTKIATVDNVVDLVEEVLDIYQSKLEQLEEIKELISGI